ncbi:MAG: hypothetical protein ACREL7_08935 [Longimicrobiales bacterium]
MRSLMGCLRRLIALAIVLLVLGAAYVYRDRLGHLWAQARARFGGEAPVAAGPQVSEEIAQEAERKLEAMAQRESDRTALSGIELESLLVYRYRQLLPAFVDSPRIEIDASRVRLRMRIPVDRIPQSAEFEDIAPFLPDTADIAVSGQLIPAGDSTIAFAVDELRAQHIPLPARLVPGALEMLGREDAPGLPADAIALPLPKGVRAAYFRADSLILLSVAGQPRN